MKSGVTACLTAVALSLPLGVHAAPEDELADIRQQMQTLQQQYETRLKELETRLEQTEAQERQTREELAESQAALPAAETASAATAGISNAFNPALSVILQGSVNSYSENPDKYALPGFQLGDEGALAAEGLTLDETEVTASANVDP